MEGIDGYVIVQDVVFDFIKNVKLNPYSQCAGHQVVAVGTFQELRSVPANGEFDNYELYGTKKIQKKYREIWLVKDKKLGTHFCT